MTRKIRMAVLLAMGLGLAAPAAAEVLTFDDAWQMVLVEHPTLAATTADLEAREADVAQAGRGLNPELEFEVENFAGNGIYSGFEAADMTLLLSQTWERGGKADSRRAVAQAGLEASHTAADLTRLVLRANLVHAFVEVLAARDRVALADTLVQVADRDRQAVSRRVDAGAENRIAAQRADLEWSAARREGDRTREALHAARLRLGTFWGDDRAAYPPVSGDLTLLVPVPEWDEVLAQVENSPSTRLAAAELARARTTVGLAASTGAVDLTTAAGVRRFQGSSDHAFVVAVGIPLGIRNLNRDGQRASAADVVRHEAEARAAAVDLKVALADAWSRLDSSQSDVLAIRYDMMPAAAGALEEAYRAYAQGAYSLTDVLAVRRTWADWQLAHVDALARHHLAAADLAALLGNDIAVEARP